MHIVKFNLTQSGLGSDGNEEVLNVSQSSSITGASPLNYLVSYLGHSLWGPYPSAEMQSVYSRAPVDWAIRSVRRCPWCNSYRHRCPWCNSYRHRFWIRGSEFNSWTRLIAFHIALIPLGKVWIQLFSLQLWVNSRAD